MRNRLLHSVAFAIVALFAVTVADYLILAQVGVRLLPLDYETLEVAFFVLGALSVVVGLLVYRRPQEARSIRILSLSHSRATSVLAFGADCRLFRGRRCILPKRRFHPSWRRSMHPEASSCWSGPTRCHP